MHTNVTLLAFLLHSIATPCIARSAPRSVSLNALDLPSPLNTSLSDPALPITTLPYEVPLNNGHNTKLRVTSYTAPHVQSFNLLPCIVDMMSTTFTKLSTENIFGLKILGDQIMAPLEYPDLISLAKMLVMFQRKYMMPGLQFEYWFKGQMLGQGHAWMQFAEGKNGTAGLSQS